MSLTLQAKRDLTNGAKVYKVKRMIIPMEKKLIIEISIAEKFPKVFANNFLRLPSIWEIEFAIYLELGVAPIQGTI